MKEGGKGRERDEGERKGKKNWNCNVEKEMCQAKERKRGRKRDGGERKGRKEGRERKERRVNCVGVIKV